MYKGRRQAGLRGATLVEYVLVASFVVVVVVAGMSIGAGVTAKFENASAKVAAAGALSSGS